MTCLVCNQDSGFRVNIRSEKDDRWMAFHPACMASAPTGLLVMEYGDFQRSWNEMADACQMAVRILTAERMGLSMDEVFAELADSPKSLVILVLSVVSGLCAERTNEYEVSEFGVAAAAMPRLVVPPPKHLRARLAMRALAWADRNDP